MNQKKIISIPAYTTFRGGGLMHFLFQAIQALSRNRPDWTFNVIGSICVPELATLASENVHVYFWDDDIKTRFAYGLGTRIFRLLGKDVNAGFLFQKRAEMYGFRWGVNAKRIQLLQNADAIWIPHYNISLDNISLIRDIQNIQLPVLLTVHDIHPAFYPEDHSADDLARFYNGLIPMAKRSQTIMTHSEFQKAAIASNLRISINKIMVTAQPPLIDPNILLTAYNPIKANSILARYSIHRNYAFYPASTTHVHKNHTRLLAAWALLKEQLGRDCPLLVCTGKGNKRQYKRLAALVEAFGLINDVIFTGEVKTTNLATLFQKCTMVVIPTLFEGAGSGILTDALVIGKPVVCSDIPQIREQLAEIGKISISTFDPNNVWELVDAVKSVLANQNGQQSVSQKNQIQAESKYNEMWHSWAIDYIASIENMTKN